MKRLPLAVLSVLLMYYCGLAQTFTDRSDLLNPPTSNGGIGASAVDFNNDGFVDLYHPGKLILNTPSGFQDILLSSNIIEGAGVFGAAFGDFNADSYPDILFEDLSAASRFYLNNKDHTFTQINDEINLQVRAPAQGAAWGDFNGDGLLDLFVNNDFGENQLFKNIGNNQYSDISLSAGVEAVGNSYGMSWGDYNNDGLPDIFIATCNFLAENSIKHLLRNNGDETFTDVNVEAGVNDSLASWGIVWLDYDNDGDQDVYIANTEHFPRPGTNRLYRNDSDGTFSDVSFAAGVDGGTNENSYGVSTADFDNDGWLDIYVANLGQPARLYRNNRNGTFSDIASSAGLAGNIDYAVAVADINRDGWVDIFIPGSPENHLWYNNGGTNHWLSVKTRGTTGNYHGISARVELYTGSLRQIREVTAGDGFCSQNFDLGVHFGMGTAASADSLIIRWPGGQVDRLFDVPADQVLTVVENEGINSPPGSFRLLEPADASVAIGNNDVTFRWRASASLDGDPLSYQLHLFGLDGDTTFAAGDTTITIPASVFAARTFCRWSVDVSDSRSTLASRDVFRFLNTECNEDNTLIYALDANIATPNSLSYSTNWIDYDNNGTLDLFVGDLSGPNVLFKNLGNGNFQETGAGALTTDFTSQRSSAWGDYDNDGNYDVLSAHNGQPNALYRGNGSTFESVSITSSDLTTAISAWRMASWVDIENDGDLDIFISNALDTEHNALYRNDGNDSFIRLTAGHIANDQATSYGTAWGDYNNDGFLDLYIAQSSHNALYRNNGDGTFGAIVNAAIVDDTLFSVTAGWSDYDNDTDLDLFVGGFGEDRNTLYENNGDGTFTPVLTGPVVEDNVSAYTHSWGDIDNDGDLDLVVGGGSFSVLYLNDGSGEFEAADIGIFRISGLLGAAWGDYDRDGDIDLFMIDHHRNNVLLQNMGNENHWINIRCVGTASNLSAIGTRVRVKASIDGQSYWQMREITSQTGFYSQSSFQAAIGLGDASIVDSVQIEWPSGQVDIATGLEANKFYTATEGQGIMTNISVEPIAAENFALYQNYPNPFNPATAIMYQIPRRSHVTLAIYNTLGQPVRTLVNTMQAGGMYSISWDGRNDDGRQVASGVYFYRLKSGDLIRSEKMILSR